MQSTDIRSGGERNHDGPDNAPIVRLRHYLAYSTPNSVRATSNLTAALAALSSEFDRPTLEIIDVFSQPKRAMTDGIIVTPTLVGTGRGRRVVLMGDLADRLHLEEVLRSLLG